MAQFYLSDSPDTHLYPHSPPCEAPQPQGQKTPRSFNGRCRRTDYGERRSLSSLILQKKLNKTQQTKSSQTTTGTKNTPFNAESTMHVCHHFSEKQLPAKCKERHVTPPRRQQQDVERHTAPPCGQRDAERHAASQCSRQRNTERQRPRSAAGTETQRGMRPHSAADSETQRGMRPSYRGRTNL